MDEHAKLRAVCLSAVGRLHGRFGWGLLDVQDLAAQVFAEAPPAAPAALCEALARERYSLALYAACRQSDDLALRERAFAELHRYLYRAALGYNPALAEDAAQRAIELVLQQLHACRKPEAFFHFALWKLRHALKELARPAAGAGRELELDAGPSLPTRGLRQQIWSARSMPPRLSPRSDASPTRGSGRRWC